MSFKFDIANKHRRKYLVVMTMIDGTLIIAAADTSQKAMRFIQNAIGIFLLTVYDNAGREIMRGKLA